MLLDLPVQPPAAQTAYADDMAAMIVRRLNGRWAGSWGLLKTLVLGVGSFGLLPLVIWPMKLRAYAAEESAALMELAQWTRWRFWQPQSVVAIRAQAREVGVGPMPVIVSWILACLVAGLFLIGLRGFPLRFEYVLACTYWHRLYDPISLPADAQLLYQAWAGCLGIGYLIQWLSLREHHDALENFLKRFNPELRAEQMLPVRVRRRGTVLFHPLWILTAVVLCIYGAWWGIPMVLVGIEQRRYTTVTSRLARRELSVRVDLVARTLAPIVRHAWPRCPNILCQAAVRSDAHFCFRCGAEIPVTGRPTGHKA